MTALSELKKFTVVVADTGDFETMKAYTPQDATTNPSLILAAAGKAAYAALVDDAVNYAKQNGKTAAERLSLAMDKLAVNFGLEILKIVPGRVSTEIDARLSFDTQKTIEKAHFLMSLYEKAGIARERVLLKIASTWEGLQAAKVLEAEGYHCNLTLLFSLAQAVVAAENGITLISPFAGRITDFFKQKDGKEGYPPAEDPGVLSVAAIFEYYKKFGYKTQVMGASFRTKEQVMELCGCDLLTISPALLEALEKAPAAAVTPKLTQARAQASAVEKRSYTQAQFLYALNDDDMAHFKLGEGIRKFAADTEKLEKIISEKLK